MRLEDIVLKKKNLIKISVSAILSILAFLSVYILFVGFHTEDKLINGLDIAFFILVSSTLIFGLYEGGFPVFISIAVALLISNYSSINESYYFLKSITVFAILIIFLVFMTVSYLGIKVLYIWEIKAIYKKTIILIFCIIIYESYGIVLFKPLNNPSLAYNATDFLCNLIIIATFILEDSIITKTKFLSKYKYETAIINSNKRINKKYE